MYQLPYLVPTAQLLCCLVQGNTEDRPARNPRAFDENNAVRLYDETKRILTHKVRMMTLVAHVGEAVRMCTATLVTHCGAGCQDVKEERTMIHFSLALLQVKDFDPDTKFL
jgi:hypothetical protein